jgi:hypothetical protein
MGIACSAKSWLCLAFCYGYFAMIVVVVVVGEGSNLPVWQ